jgi:hypothetical protein
MMGAGQIMPASKGRFFVQLIGDNLTGAVNRPEVAIILG